MPTSARIAETDEGYLELKGNETILKDTSSGDPVAYRGHSTNAKGIIKISADLEQKGGGELGFLLGKADERYPPDFAAGIWEVFCRKPGMGSIDKAMTRVARFQHDGLVLFDANGEPISFDEGEEQRHKMYSPDGRWMTQQQNDGNLVTYDTHDPEFRTNPAKAAVWSAWGGGIN